eukprot:1710305-Amphidinium_carterae.1
MIPEFNATMCNSHISNSKLEQLQLHQLDILKCSVSQHQTIKWVSTCHQTHFNTVISAATSSHPTCHQ